MGPPRFVGRVAELRTLVTAYEGPASGLHSDLRPAAGRQERADPPVPARTATASTSWASKPRRRCRSGEFLEAAAARPGRAAPGHLAGRELERGPGCGVSPLARRDRKLVLALRRVPVDASGQARSCPRSSRRGGTARWEAAGNVLLILCGSYIGFMEREVLGRKSPLFGRRTAQILLRPFGYREAAVFHPATRDSTRPGRTSSAAECPATSAASPTPARSRPTSSAEMLDEYAPLHREADFLLREELREVESYYAVLLAIAAGHATRQAIAAGRPARRRAGPSLLPPAAR